MALEAVEATLYGCLYMGYISIQMTGLKKCFASELTSSVMISCGNDGRHGDEEEEYFRIISI